MNISTTKMEIVLARYFKPRLNLVVPNVSWGLGWYLPGGQLHECDLLIMTPSNYLWECEIKVSLQDLKQDRFKWHKHIHPSIKRLYFGIPWYLEKHSNNIPERAGILVVRKNYSVKTMRIPKEDRTTKPVDDKYRLKMAHLGCMRIWGLKEKVLSKQLQLFY